MAIIRITPLPLERRPHTAYICLRRVLPGTSCANIPEAIHFLWELSLFGSWSDAYGPHLMLLASEDIPATTMVVPPPHIIEPARDQ